MRKRIIETVLGIEVSKTILDKFEVLKPADPYDQRNWFEFKCKKCGWRDRCVVYHNEIPNRLESYLKLHYYQFHKSRRNLVCHEKAPTQLIGDDYKDMYTWERNDCVPRACSIAFELPYPDVHEMFKKAGRRDKTGTAFYIYNLFYRNGLGKYKTEYTRLDYKLKLKEFLKANPIGRFLASTKNHQFAIIDGIVMDTFQSKLSQKLEHYYKLVEV